MRIICRARIALLLLTATLAACQSAPSKPRPVAYRSPGAPTITIVDSQSFTDLGAGQGIAKRLDAANTFIYLYGDADTGIIREYEIACCTETELAPTGRAIALTVDGKDVISHPTGLTFHPKHGAFLGDTVKGKGVIYHIDWQQALKQGNLDGAILNVIEDDAAVNGCRPEFVEYQGRWLIATADYGDIDNHVRLYDPARLAKAKATTAPGVLVASFPCGPFVQSLSWVPEHKTLVLVQNQIAGLYYRLTFARLAPGADLRNAPRVDLDHPDDELEGWALVTDTACIFFSSSREDNVHGAEIEYPAR